MYRFVLVVAAVLHSTLALYSSQDDVVELTPSNFQKEVINSDELWLVEFYAPWCGHCQSLVPEYKKAAKALKGVVKVGAVNADEHQSLGGQYQVQGFPTLKFFGANKRSPTDYNGQRTAKGMVDECMSKLRSMVQDRLGGRSGGSSGGGSRSGGGGGGNPNDVVELTDSNFEQLVLKSDDIWMVEFFAPWCGHCKNLVPHWASAATQMKGKVKFGALDATVHSSTASRYGVRGYPTIKAFERGQEKEYDGGRTSSDIVQWVQNNFEVEKIPPPEVVQVVSPDVFATHCEEHPICVVAILPDILDCQSECRNGYIKLLTKMGDTFKKMKWGWIWAEAMAQPKLETALGIGGFGYPAMAAVNSKKLKYSLLTRAFSETGIREFLRDLSYGKGSTAPLSKLPEIKKTEPWDGKDGQMPVEDDIDLSDVELDDINKDEL